MATTINAYSVSLGLDASNYIDSSKLSRTETNLLKRDIAAARDPMEKLQLEVDRLDRAFDEGAISIGLYSRLMDDKKRKILGVNDAVQQQTSLMTRLSEVGNVVSGMRNAWDMAARAIGVAERAFTSFNNEAQRLDDIKDKAEKLGLSYRELGALQFAASRLGGADAMAAIDKAMGEMLKRGLVQQGENAVDAFKRVANEISVVADQSERAVRASDTFGKSGIELLAVLSAGADEIGNLADQWDRTNGLTNQQIELVGRYNDQLEDIERSFTAIKIAFVGEMAPAMTVFLKEISDIDNTIKGWSDVFGEMADNFATNMGRVKNALQWFQSGTRFGGAGPGVPGSFVPGVGEDRDNVWDMEMKFKNEIRKADADAQEAAFQREQARIKQLNSDFSDLIDGNAAMWDGFLKDKEQANKALMQSLEQAQRDLDRQFQESQRMRDKTVADVGKGPRAFDATSKEYLTFAAEQVNKAMADALIEQPTPPTDEEILKAAQENMKLQAEQNAKTEELRKRLETLIEVAKENGFKRFR